MSLKGQARKIRKYRSYINEQAYYVNLAWKWDKGENRGLITLDDLANQCGFFESIDISVNNGYICNHPRQEEKDIENGKIYGCCGYTCCPIAIIADLTHLKEHDLKLYAEWKQEFAEELANNGEAEEDCCPYDKGGEWMVIG
jgi:hypothetical protein